MALLYVLNVIATVFVALLFAWCCAKAYLAVSLRYNIWYVFNAKPFRKKP